MKPNQTCTEAAWWLFKSSQVLKQMHIFPIIQHSKQLLRLLGGLQLVGVPLHLWLLKLPKHTTLLRGSCLETGGHWGRANAGLGWTPVKSLWLRGMGCTLRGWQSFTVTICMSEFTSKADTGPATCFPSNLQAFKGRYITLLSEVFNGCKWWAFLHD